MNTATNLLKKCPRCERKVRISHFESHYEHCSGLKRLTFRVKLAMAIAAIIVIGMLYWWYFKNPNSNQANVPTNENPVALPSKQRNLPIAEVIRQGSSLFPNPRNDNKQGDRPLRELKYGEKLLLLSPKFVGNGWYHVRHQVTGLEGWIHGKNIRLENSQLETEPTTSTTPFRDADLNAENIRVVITPLRHPRLDVIYGAEARDDAGILRAIAKQVAVEDNLLVVEETQYSSTGVVVYRGKLFFAGTTLVKQEKIEGIKSWEIFHSWISDRP